MEARFVEFSFSYNGVNFMKIIKTSIYTIDNYTNSLNFCNYQFMPQLTLTNKNGA